MNANEFLTYVMGAYFCFCFLLFFPSFDKMSSYRQVVDSLMMNDEYLLNEWCGIQLMMMMMIMIYDF